jgi:hypothetical protein
MDRQRRTDAHTADGAEAEAQLGPTSGDEEAVDHDIAAGAEAVRADKPASVGSDGCARVTAASGLPRG